ncbi:MAG: energy-coupling factor ABC transporter ATP-binding protein [Treponema sp.]|jgi:biotin transport system ATP-binding protein|nr:energy-coupling factor ABC transporter ATP-binding protein [Treponema sp.]
MNKNEYNKTGTALFSIKNISKIFPGVSGAESYHALSDINLDIIESQCLLIAGSNGSGKTMLMRIIAGLLEPSCGEVLLRGQPLYAAQRGATRRIAAQRMAEKSLRRELGLVFQDADAQIIGETVEEDIAFGPENLGLSKTETGERVQAALEALGLFHRRELSPRRLSGGEKRRLAVAGIIAMGCNTVIMDEPFANLDWPGVAQTLAIIRDLKKEGKTLIILTHELEKVLAFADRLVILHKGSIRDDGPPAAVLDRLDPAWGVRDPRRNYAAIEDCSWLEE